MQHRSLVRLFISRQHEHKRLFSGVVATLSFGAQRFALYYCHNCRQKAGECDLNPMMFAAYMSS